MKISKKISFAITLFSLCTFYAMSQTGSGFGIKAGLNYGGNGVFESVSSVRDNPDQNIGFHIGVFGKIGNQLYLRPELVYTNLSSNYNTGDFSLNKLDVPLLVGLKVIGPLHVFAGPSIQYILDSDFEGVKAADIESDLTVGFNFGVGVNLNKLGIDLRYERGFTDNEASFIDNNNINLGTLDTRPEQLIVSLSYMF